MEKRAGGWGDERSRPGGATGQVASRKTRRLSDVAALGQAHDAANERRSTLMIHPLQLEIYIQHHRQELIREAQQARLAELLPRVKRGEDPKPQPQSRLELATAQ
jgi:hypothetical protein